MPSRSRIVVAVAGGGKTTRITREAASSINTRTALVTYTRNNARELESRLYSLCRTMPPQIEVNTWFHFLLHELARPYSRSVWDKRIDGIAWSEGRSARYVSASDVANFYFNVEGLVYSDKISQFVCLCDRMTGGAVLRRLAQRFEHIYVDEVQDFSGYDLDVLELMMRSNVRLTLVGDHRQSTYSTNNSARNSGYAGTRIVKKFKEWADSDLAELVFERESHRCRQPILDVANLFFPDDPGAISRNGEHTEHDGVFTVDEELVDHYVERFSPQILRLDKRTACGERPALNFGESKGMTFERVLIYPHQLAKKWLATGDITKVLGSAAKMYVGITRARHSVAFVFAGKAMVPGIRVYTP